MMPQCDMLALHKVNGVGRYYNYRITEHIVVRLVQKQPEQCRGSDNNQKSLIRK